MPNLLQHFTQGLRRRFIPTCTPLEPILEPRCRFCNSSQVFAEARCASCYDEYMGQMEEAHDHARLNAYLDEQDEEDRARYAATFEEARRQPLTPTERRRVLSELQWELDRLGALERGHRQALDDPFSSFLSSL